MNPSYEAIERLGRDGFYVKKSNKTSCPDCLQGPTGQSIESCDTCNSSGYVENVFYVPIKAIISWQKFESFYVVINSVVTKGDCAVAISADDFSCINQENDTFLVDGKEMILQSVNPSDHHAIYLLGLIYNE